MRTKEGGKLVHFRLSQKTASFSLSPSVSSFTHFQAATIYVFDAFILSGKAQRTILNINTSDRFSMLEFCKANFNSLSLSLSLFGPFSFFFLCSAFFQGKVYLFVFNWMSLFL